MCLSLWMSFIFIGILRSNQFLQNMQLWFGYGFVICGSVWGKSVITTGSLPSVSTGRMTFLLLSLNFFQLFFFQLEMCCTSLPASSSWGSFLVCPILLLCNLNKLVHMKSKIRWLVEKIVATQIGQHGRLLLFEYNIELQYLKAIFVVCNKLPQVFVARIGK